MKDEGGGCLFNSPDLLTSKGPTHTGISEDVAGPPPRQASHALKAQDPLSAHQLLPLHLLSALNIVHTPKVSQTRN